MFKAVVVFVLALGVSTVAVSAEAATTVRLQFRGPSGEAVALTSAELLLSATHCSSTEEALSGIIATTVDLSCSESGHGPALWCTREPTAGQPGSTSRMWTVPTTQSL